MYAELILCSPVNMQNDMELPSPVTDAESGRKKTNFSQLEVRNVTDHTHMHPECLKVLSTTVKSLIKATLLIMTIPDANRIYYFTCGCCFVRGSVCD